MLRSRVKKKRVMMYLMLLLMKFHILRKLIRIKKLVHNGHTEKKIINGSKHPFLPHFSNLCPNPYPQILYSFDSLMCLCLSHTHDIICF